MQQHASNLPNTIARVFVALRSFLAELFSLFFLLALLALYIVNLDPADAFFRSFLQEDDSTLGVLASCSGRSEPALFSRFSSCLFAPPLLPFLLVCVVEDTLVGPRVGGGDDEVDEDGGPDVIRGFGLGLEFVSSGSWIITLLAATSYPLESVRCTCGVPVSWACATALKRQLPFECQKGTHPLHIRVYNPHHQSQFRLRVRDLVIETQKLRDTEIKTVFRTLT